jgi:hypothetical protein
MLSITLSVLIGLTSVSAFCTEKPQEKKVHLPAWLSKFDKHLSSASSRERFLASVGLSLGINAAMLGALGTTGGYELSPLKKLGPQGSYAFLMIPGMLLALCSGTFLFKSAKGWYSKLNSLMNSCALFSGAGCFVIGTDYVLKQGANDIMLMGACAVLFTALGISDNVYNHTEPQKEVDTEQS